MSNFVNMDATIRSDIPLIRAPESFFSRTFLKLCAVCPVPKTAYQVLLYYIIFLSYIRYKVGSPLLHFIISFIYSI